MRPQVLSALLTTVLELVQCLLSTPISLRYYKVLPRNTSVRHGNAGADWCRILYRNYLGGKLADRSVNGTLKGFCCC